MIVRNGWSMVACVCLVGALGCSSKSDPSASSVPKITTFSPESGLTGITVTLNGSGFDGTTNVSVGGASATFTRKSDTELTLLVPTTAMTGVIAVVNRLGSGGSPKSFAVLPDVTSISPVKGSAGTSVTITGTGLGKISSVMFGTEPASHIIITSATQIIATVPWAASTGPLTVVSADGSTALTTPFTYSDGGITKPVLSGVYPLVGDPGDGIHLTGSGFTAVSAVKVGGVACSFTFLSDTAIDAVVPTAGISGPVEMVSNLGNATSNLVFNVRPTITKFAPPAGPSGTLVTIEGVGFMGATSVSFGNAVPSNFIVVDANHAQANVAKGSATGPISLVSSGLTCQSGAPFTFLEDASARPVLTTVQPLQALAGDTVTVTGSGFTGVTGVTVGGAAVAAFHTVNDTELTFVVPPAAASGFISATNAFGTNSSSDSFVVTPTITSITPLQGAPGTLVTLAGTGFVGTSAVTFGGSSAAPFVVLSANQVQATVPADAATGAVTLTSTGVACHTDNNNTFTVTN